MSDTTALGRALVASGKYKPHSGAAMIPLPDEPPDEDVAAGHGLDEFVPVLPERNSRNSATPQVSEVPTVALLRRILDECRRQVKTDPGAATEF